MKNPPAFPVPVHKIYHDTRPEDFKKNDYEGMTLRDYFASASLPSLITEGLRLNHESWDATAQHAYIIADAMLRYRGK